MHKYAQIDYPLLFRSGKIAHHELAYKLLHQGELSQDNALKSLKCYLDDHAALETILFSSESLIGLFGTKTWPVTEAISDLAAEHGYQLEIHLILRRMADFLEAMYLQSHRFGRLKMAFRDYIKSRCPWIDSLFQSVKRLACVKDLQLFTVFYHSGFDTNQYFEDVLGLPSGSLTGASSKLRPSSRFGMNGEILLANIDIFNEEYSCQLRRPQVIHALETRQLFSADVFPYTLYDENTWRNITSFSIQSALQAKFFEYAAAFQGSEYNAYRLTSLGYDELSRDAKNEVIRTFNLA
ncbi:hypothetical protein [Cyanobium sp. CH-040]|uniref:hypothetical protein n=1 Tax=Cyanobium sp. CH-040 TaxID=2823708 RepID=UPI0020CCA0A9|nr:hypothetical protein [Cyanobium sp. CH-040]